MGTSYVGDKSTGRFYRLHQGLYVARMTCSHLYYGNVVAVVKTEKGLGHTDVVVEVAFGVHNVVLLPQHSSNEFLCCCLAVSTSNAYNRDVKTSAMFTCKVLEGLQTVVNLDNRIVVKDDSQFFTLHS